MNAGEVEFKITADNETEEGLEDAEKSFEEAGKQIGNVFKAIAGAVAAAKIAETVKDVAQESIDAFAKFEQLSGGIETLFKDSADAVKRYADEAFSAAGMSANEYMETVTGFSASLISSLNGNTAAAAELANQAIVDMSDNANKMGSTMESVQSAYAGFSKGQFQLLDNLKLGYGGTKTEMERLLKDAEKLRAAQGETVSYSIDSFADITQAIHDIQTEMDITGTTQREAATTITGSINMAKAAWQNLLVAFSDGNADMDGMVDKLIESITAVEKNLLPRIQEVLPNIAEGLKEITAELLPSIPAIAEEIIPPLIDGLEGISEVLLDTITKTAGDIVSNGPEIVNAVFDVADEVLNSVLQSMDELSVNIGDSLPDIINTVIDRGIEFISNNLPKVLESVIKVSEQIIRGLAQGLTDSLPTLIEKAPEVLIQLTDALIQSCGEVARFTIELTNKIADALVHHDWRETADQMMDNLINAIDGAQKNVQVFLDNTFSDGKLYGNDVNNVASTEFIGYMKAGKEEFVDAIGDFTEGVAAAYDKGAEELGIQIEESTEKVSEAFKHGYTGEEVYDADEADRRARAVLDKYKKTGDAISTGTQEVTETLESAIDELDRLLKLREISEEEYWSRRRQILEKYRDENDETWLNLYDKTETYYEKLAKKEKTAQEKALKEQEQEREKAQKEAERQLKENVENKFRDLETEQIKKGYDDSWLQEQERAFIETLDHNSEIYKDYNLKLLKEQKSTDDKATKEAKSAAEKQRKELEKAYDAVVKANDKMSDSFDVGLNDLFKFETQTDKHSGAEKRNNTLAIEELEKQIEAKRKLPSVIAKLMDNEVPDDLIRELLKMDPTDALEYAQKLASSPKMMERVKSAYAEDRKLSDQMADMLTESTEDFEKLGHDVGQVFGENFMDALGEEWEKKLGDILSDPDKYAAFMNATGALAMADRIGKAYADVDNVTGAASSIVNAAFGSVGEQKLKLVDANGQYIATLVNTENDQAAARTGG